MSLNLNPDLIAGLIAFLFTLVIFSYLIGDNPLFRIAVYVFVGVSAGYVAVVAFWQVLWPDLLRPFFTGPTAQKAILLVPFVLSGLLLMKGWPSLTRLGMPAMGVLVGVGAAVALGGAVVGTILPQVNATAGNFAPATWASAEAPFDALIILAGVITTLVYFHFGARATADGAVRRFQPIEIGAFVGGIFVAIALGVLFAGVYSAALTAFIERLYFLGTWFGF
jgi:hypothetical protein